MAKKLKIQKKFLKKRNLSIKTCIPPKMLIAKTLSLIYSLMTTC